MANNKNRKPPTGAETTTTTTESGDALEAKFARNAPNGDLSAQEKYFQVNTSNRQEVAYAVNNNQLSVDDLPADFDALLLTENKRAEFAARKNG